MTVVSRRRALGGLAAAFVAGPLLAACGSSADDGSGSTQAAAGSTKSDLQILNVGVVPSLSLGYLSVGEKQGFFAEQGIQLNITPVDSGPTVITGLVSGQYDLGYTAYAPPLLAVAQGQQLRLVNHLDNVSKSGNNGGVVVKAGGSITSWKDLVGKKIGVNAPRSLGVLEIQGSIAKDGGDASTPDKLQLVPLPFNQIADQVESGAVDAGFLLEPFLTAAEQKSGLVNLGDPAITFLPTTTPVGGIFTSAKTEESKSDLIKRFQTAFAAAAAYGNTHLDEVRASGAQLSGLTPQAAELIPLDPVATAAPAKADFEPLLKALVDYGWTPNSVNIDQFLGQ